MVFYGNATEHTSGILKNRTLCSVLATAERPAQQTHLRSLLYLLHLHCNSSLRSSWLTASSARPKPPRGDAPITHRVAPRLSSHCAPSPTANTPPRHAVPMPVPTPACHATSLAASSCCRRHRSPPGGRGSERCRRHHDARPQLTTSRDPEWLDPERASLAAPRTPFLP